MERFLTWCLLLGIVCLVLLLPTLGYMYLKDTFDTPREYKPQIEKIATTYEPKPKPFIEKKITKEIVEKASFEVLY